MGMKYTYVETGGGHIWKCWRIYLAELAQLLFKKPGKIRIEQQVMKGPPAVFVLRVKKLPLWLNRTAFRLK